ncbi:MAG TPA: lipopolysaccharide biosynthesis protein RfbH, partial [Geothrix sp.]|nr:lipopolysaccharide biosynthesis protein RfbH [Geothrix sp.]
MTADALRAQILELVAEYYRANWPERPFTPGESPVPVSGKIFDARDLQHLVEAGLDFWLTTGRFANTFEARFAAFMEQKHCLLVNSGSSANLLALTALTAPELGERRLLPGDEVITCATGFPTTVNPILQNQLVPVFLDVHVPTYNMDPSRLEEAVGPRTKAIMVAHTLGNPFDLDAVMAVARKHGLWVVEDCCDAVGARYKGRMVGTFGDLATTSFYPAHHITMGEGGAVLTGSPKLKKLVESFRDWGRDCWCEPGRDNTCGKRFDWQLGGLPHGYDHKYTYSRLGYNLKATDMQAAVGVSQLDKLPGFLTARQANHQYLLDRLKPLEAWLQLPEAT